MQEDERDVTEASLPVKRVYRSIFLDDGWAHQKYFGWTLAKDRPGLRVLRKKRLAFTRSLMLLSKGGEEWLSDEVAQGCGHLGLADIIIHDFDGVLLEPSAIAGRRFHRAEQHERLLNSATYVVDLENSEEKLWENLGSKSRNAVRKAELNGLEFICDGNFEESMSCFYKLYEPIARTHNLQTPSSATFDLMQKQGNLICVSCQDNRGETSIINILYLTDQYSFYIYGASDSDVGTGAGQFIQWNTFLLLKKLGYTWYDLGGVQSETPMDGIHRFKKSLGGAFYKVGDEFRYESPGFGVAQACLAQLRKKSVSP